MNPPLARSKVLRLKDLARHSGQISNSGRTVILTNGCFDLLHVGHVRYLEAARALGNVLVVGVNTDDSVRRLKGPDRPLVGEVARAEVVAGLASVDWVVLFPDTTAIELVRQVRPSIYVKGGDYSADPASDRFPSEGHEVLAGGGELRILPLTPGSSTTELLRRFLARPGGGDYNAGS